MKHAADKPPASVTRIHASLLRRIQRLHGDLEYAWSLYKTDRSESNLHLYTIQLRRAQRIQSAIHNLPV